MNGANYCRWRSCASCGEELRGEGESCGVDAFSPESQPSIFMKGKSLDDGSGQHQLRERYRVNWRAQRRYPQCMNCMIEVRRMWPGMGEACLWVSTVEPRTWG